MMKTTVSFVILCVGFSALAQVVTLNPGDTNTTGAVLTCSVGSGGGTSSGGGAYTPPAPPVTQPVFVGQYTVEPNRACLNAITPADPKTIDDRLTGCGNITEGSSICDSTTVDKTWVDEGCYNTLYSKETLKAAIHPDQGADLQTACTFTRYNCYQNQVVNQ